MIKIQVEIKIFNHKKIIETQKGKIASIATKLLPNSHELVEKEIYEIIRSSIENQLKKELIDNQVEAEVTVY